MKIGKLKKKYSKITCKILAGYFFLRTFAPLEVRGFLYIRTLRKIS